MDQHQVSMSFTDEEIDHAVHTLVRMDWEPESQILCRDAVRAILRSVRAVPARLLNGGLAGNPGRPGERVKGQGLQGVQVVGTIVDSHPVTTTIRTPEGKVGWLWTNTLNSWDPSVDQEPKQPPGAVRVTDFAEELDLMRAEDDGMPAAWVSGLH